MRKFTSLLLVTSMVFAFAACSGTSGKNDSGKGKDKSKRESREEQLEPAREYTAEDAYAIVDTYYTVMVEREDFDTYYALCYPEHVQGSYRASFARREGVEPDEIDLEQYARDSYEESFDIIQGLFDDPSYEIYGCLIGGTDDESQAALEKYLADTYEDAGDRDLDHWKQMAIDLNCGYLGGDADKIENVFVFSAKCTSYRELISVYQYEGQLYLGKSLDQKYG